MCVCVCTFVCDTWYLGCLWFNTHINGRSYLLLPYMYLSYLKQAFLEGSRESSLSKCHHMYGHISLLDVQICSSHVEEITLCVSVSVDYSMSGLMKADKVNVPARYVRILGLRNKVPLFPIRL